jgi:PAS domain S-box-containing protein
MITARDVMTHDPYCLDGQMDVQEAVEFFLDRHVSSAPVLDSKGHVLGQLAELDLMRAFVMRKVQDTHFRKVADFQRFLQKPSFVKATTLLPEIVAQLMHTPLHRVLVSAGDGALVGIISPKDVLRALNGEEAHPSAMKKRLTELEAQVKDLGGQLKSASSGLDKYRQLFESNPSMMHSVDSHGTILLANPAIHEFLGYAPGELIGKTVFDLYPETIHDLIRQGLKEVVTSGHHKFEYTSLLRKNGSVVRVEVISSALYDHDAKFVGTVTLTRPVDGENLLRALHGVFDPQS